MNTAVAKALAKIGLLVAAIVIATGAPAKAQSLQYALRANIPFDFTVGNEKLPAGKYSFQRAQPNAGDMIIQISGKGHSIISRSTIPVITFTPKDKSTLVFHKYGDEYFLVEVWPAAAGTGRELIKSRAEREAQRRAHDYVGMAAMKAPQPETVTIVAN